VRERISFGSHTMTLPWSANWTESQLKRTGGVQKRALETAWQPSRAFCVPLRQACRLREQRPSVSGASRLSSAPQPSRINEPGDNCYQLPARKWGTTSIAMFAFRLNRLFLSPSKRFDDTLPGSRLPVLGEPCKSGRQRPRATACVIL